MPAPRALDSSELRDDRSCAGISRATRYLREGVLMAEQVDVPIVPTEVRGCLIMGKRFPEEMPEWAKEKFISIAWEQAKEDEPGLREQLSEVSLTPLDFEVQVVASPDLDFPKASAVAARAWMDKLIPTTQAPHYRQFLWVGHIDVAAVGERFNLVLVALAFGTTKG